MGIFLAIGIAIVIFIILNKTTFGYELKACGSNREASRYAGLNEKKNIILSMAIAGALAGMGACFYFLNSIEFKYSSQYAGLPAYGFNGIASAFLANCHPIGIIFSSIFIRWLNNGGEFLSGVGFNRYIADIVVAVIIYLAGFTRFVGELITKIRKKKEKEISKVDGTVIERKDSNTTNETESVVETTESEEEPPNEEAINKEVSDNE